MPSRKSGPIDYNALPEILRRNVEGRRIDGGTSRFQFLKIRQLSPVVFDVINQAPQPGGDDDGGAEDDGRFLLRGDWRAHASGQQEEAPNVQLSGVDAHDSIVAQPITI